MAIGALTGIALGLQGAMGAGRMIGGWIGANRARRDMAKLEGTQPMYQAPKEYGQQLDIQNKLIAGGLPGYDKMKDEYGAMRAQEVAQGEKYGGSIDQVRTNALAANQRFRGSMANLGIQAVNFQAQQQQNKIGLLNTGINIHDTKFQTNQLDPWNRQYDMAAQKMGVNQSQAWGGMNQMGSALGNFAGLNEYSIAMDKMNPNA